MHEIKAYIKVISLPLKLWMQYRTDFFLNMSLFIVPWYVQFFLFKAVYASNIKIGTYTFGKLISYYFVTVFLQEFMPLYGLYDITDQIKSGGLSLFLSKPCNYILYYFFYELGMRITTFLQIAMASITFIPFVHSYIYIPQPTNVFCFAVFLIIGFVIAFSLGFMFNASSFWLGDAYNGFQFYDLIIWIFAGGLLPLDVLPFSKFLIYLPFSYTAYIPAKILLYNGTSLHRGFLLLMGLLWAVALLFAASYMYQMGLKRYEAVGG